MPYIVEERRSRLDPAIDNLLEKMLRHLLTFTTKGDLTYVLYKITQNWIFRDVTADYDRRSNGLSALIDAERELRRRQLDPYEDTKREVNGDIE